MQTKETGLLEQYTGSLSQRIEREYYISEKYYRDDVKRGLRNSDGTGVPIGVTRVGSVLGYMIEDGVRVPVPGQLYYRGIELNEIVEAHRKAGTSALRRWPSCCSWASSPPSGSWTGSRRSWTGPGSCPPDSPRT